MTYCPLCDLRMREPENVLAKDNNFLLVRTKFMKGHKERLMILSKEHDKKGSWQWQYYVSLWKQEIENAFNYTYKIVVLDGKYGSIPEHWHVILTDMESSDTDEHRQMLGTPWLRIIDIKPWKEEHKVDNRIKIL